MSKAQSFGVDVMMTLIAVLIFNQLLLVYSAGNDASILFSRSVENNQLLALSLEYNNSLALFDSFACNGNLDSLAEFNKTITHILNTYLKNREYLLAAEGLVYSSEGVDSVCLKRASPAELEVLASCGKALKFQFSIYTKGEKGEC